MKHINILGIEILVYRGSDARLLQLLNYHINKLLDAENSDSLFLGFQYVVVDNLVSQCVQLNLFDYKTAVAIITKIDTILQAF